MISTDEMGVSLVWQASWSISTAGLRRQPTPDDDLGAFYGVEAFVDNQAVPCFGVNQPSSDDVR